MNGRERVLAAVNGGQPDRIPIDFWAVGEVFERLASELGMADAEAVLERFDSDVRVFRGPCFSVGRADENGRVTDHWGVKRKTHAVTGQRRDGTGYIWTSKHLAESPLTGAQSIADIERHPWPDASELDYSGVREACRSIRDAGYAVVFGGDRLDRTAQLKAGLDILQSLQPGSMRDDFQRLKREYGADLCFQGGIDIQHILPNGSPEEVRRHVKETAQILGDGGGYIFGTAHNILPDTPTRNILALIDAYHEFGRYV